MTAFQIHEGIFAWDRLTMGTRPASTVQQSAYYRAMDTYLPAKWRHRFASYANDIAAGADTLEELFELIEALIECFDEAGIQVKASKLIFGVREISFHNYTISKDHTRQRRKLMSYTQHVYSEEHDRAKGLLRLYVADESMLLVLWHCCLTVAPSNARNGTVSQAMASGNRLRYSISQNQINDA
jgi:hypothetical protein